MQRGVRAVAAIGGISLLGMALSAASARSSSVAPGSAGLRTACAARGRPLPSLVADPALAPPARIRRVRAAC